MSEVIKLHDDAEQQNNKVIADSKLLRLFYLYRAADAKEKEYKKKKKPYNEKIKNIVGQEAIVESKDGVELMEVKHIYRDSFDEKAFRKDHPEEVGGSHLHHRQRRG